MDSFSILKTVHVTCAVLSVAGFTVRGVWALGDNPMRQRRVAKTLPHLIDTCLLGSAVGMLVIWGVSPAALPWVTAKILALLLYIALGMIALRFAQTFRGRLAAYLGALCVAAYIVAVALAHSLVLANLGIELPGNRFFRRNSRIVCLLSCLVGLRCALVACLHSGLSGRNRRLQALHIFKISRLKRLDRFLPSEHILHGRTGTFWHYRRRRSIAVGGQCIG